MLHNSVYRRELLLKMNAHPLVVRRRDVHRTVGRREGVRAGAGEVMLAGRWDVQAARGATAERLVAEDARDFLGRMGVDVGEGARNVVLLEEGSCEAGFRTTVAEGRVEVHGTDAAGLWAGWVSLENRMRGAGGPVLARGEVSRRPAWGVQVAPPTWGANYAVPDFSQEYLGDDTFRTLAHAGADGMFIYGDWVLYARGTSLKELDCPEAERNIAVLKDAADRAAGYGVRLYFVLVSPKLRAGHALFKRAPQVRGALLRHEGNAPPIHCLCSSSDEALSFHADVIGGVFKAVPELGGVICIIGGESYYHCFMRAAGAAVGETNCPRCRGKVAEDVIANLLRVTAAAVHRHAPRARVMAWPYSAQYFWSRERDQLALIDRLPEEVGLLSEVDKDQVITKPAGYQKHIWDYSVDFDGHSDRIVGQGVRCGAAGRALYVKTETAHGIELLGMPYVPSITRSARQWQSVRAVRPAGVLQRWGFIGMFDSVAERLGWQARWGAEYSPDGASQQVAREVAGGTQGPGLVEAWRKFDEAVGHLPTLTTGGYYKGPLFLGPGCPLPVWEGKTPKAFLGSLFYLAEAEATGDSSRRGAADDFAIHDVRELGTPAAEVQEAEYGRARDLAREGWERLKKIDARAEPAGAREELAEQVVMGEYLYRTMRACANVVRFLRLKAAGGKREEMEAVARDELENARGAKGMWEGAPWLNHSMRLDVGAPESLGMVAEKIRLLEEYLAR